MPTQDAIINDNIAVMHRAFAALNDGDLDTCTALMNEDFIANLPGLPSPLVGRDIWVQGTTMMRVAFPDIAVTIEEIFGAGDKVALRLRFTGTHEGDFEGIPASGKPVAFTSIEIYRFENGRIAEEWVSPDMIGLFGQISPKV